MLTPLARRASRGGRSLAPTSPDSLPSPSCPSRCAGSRKQDTRSTGQRTQDKGHTEHRTHGIKATGQQDTQSTGHRTKDTRSTGHRTKDNTASDILHPIQPPDILHPTSCARHPAPDILHPTSCARHPARSFRSPSAGSSRAPLATAGACRRSASLAPDSLPPQRCPLNAAPSTLPP